MKKFVLIVFVLFLVACNKNVKQNVSCSYFHEGVGTIIEKKDCGSLKSNGSLYINVENVDKIRYEENELACIYVYGTENDNGWYYVSKSGLGRQTPFWTDNICAPFVNNLNVSLSDGKVIFFNEKLEIVKKTDYVWAGGFKNGHCKVCLSVEENCDREKDPECHFKYSGGSCGYINENFEVIIPIEYGFKEVPKP